MMFFIILAVFITLSFWNDINYAWYWIKFKYYTRKANKEVDNDKKRKIFRITDRFRRRRVEAS